MRNHFLTVVGVTLLVLVALRGPLRRPAAEAVQRARTGEDARALLVRAGRAVVNTAVADLLVRPEEGAALADQALLGDTVQVLPGQDVQDRGFVAVETSARYRGFVSVQALWPLRSNAPAYEEAGPVVTVISRFANLYASPDVTLRNPLLVAPLGARLLLAPEQTETARQPPAKTPGKRAGQAQPGTQGGKEPGRWLKVTLPDERSAFVQRGDIQPGRSGIFDAGCVTENALRHEGTPYLWGGRSTYGIDCSGLVSNAYGACGVVPPRDADLQYDWDKVVPVTADRLSPGDLLFFGKQKITHVGIFLGQDRFVHATTTERPTVHVSPLSDPRWQGLLLGMRHHPGLANLKDGAGLKDGVGLNKPADGTRGR